MPEFKQIIGRGTRLRTDYGKLAFNIIDYTGTATEKFAEGAFAVAEPEDDNRVGSHRYLTCVPTPGLATTRFICYYLHSWEGSEKVSTASPGSADRNRTLGLKKPAGITVPVPSIENQRRFDRMQAKVQALRKAHAEACGDLERLIPTMLHEVFGGEAGCSVA